MPRRKKDRLALMKNQVLINKIYYRNRSPPDYKRVFTTLMNQTSETSKLGMAKYKFDHQPSKSDKPFQPTAPPTRVHIENITCT